MRMPSLFLPLVLLSSQVLADAVGDLPATWRERLRPIPVQEKSGIEPADVERLEDTRAELGKALSSGDDAKRLAALYGQLAGYYHAHGLSTGASLGFANARALAPEEFRWTYYAAHMALDFGQAELGLKLLAEAEALNPEYSTLALRRAEANLGLNNLQAAKADFEIAARNPEQRAAALLGLGQIDFLERNWQGTVDKLREVVTLDPKATAAHYLLGQALVRTGDRKAAREHLRQTGETKPGYADPLVGELQALQQGATFRFSQAMAAVNRGDTDAALAGFEAGLADQPDNARARTSYARVLYIAGHYDKVQPQLERAAQDGLTETLPRFLLAVLTNASGEPLEAERWLGEVLALDPDHQGANSLMGNLLLQDADYVQAMEHFNRAIAANANQPRIFLHRWVAMLGAEAGESLLADTLAETVKRFPENSLFQWLRIKLAAVARDPRVADPQWALEQARQLADQQPAPQNMELLALAQAGVGDFKEAARIQQGLIEVMADMGMPNPEQVFGAALRAFKAGQLPEPAWSLDSPLFQVRPLDINGPMRNYPAAHPY